MVEKRAQLPISLHQSQQTWPPPRRLLLAAPRAACAFRAAGTAPALWTTGPPPLAPRTEATRVPLTIPPLAALLAAPTSPLAAERLALAPP